MGDPPLRHRLQAGFLVALGVLRCVCAGRSGGAESDGD